MENPTPFDLNEAIRRWQHSLGASPALSAENLEELASHLRASIQNLQADGLSEEEAFLAATRRIGERAVLEREFAKVDAIRPRLPEESVRRIVSLICKVFGVFFIVEGIIFVTTGFVLLFTNGDDPQRLAAKTFGMSILSLVFGVSLVRYVPRFMFRLIQEGLHTTLNRFAPLQAMRSMKIIQSTWSPFQSPEVREICAHLTPAEHARLIADARQRGAEIGGRIAIPSGIAVFLFLSGQVFSWQVFSWRGYLVGLALVIIYFAISDSTRHQAMRRRSLELLCETEWARSKGYRPEHLKLMSFPWRR